MRFVLAAVPMVALLAACATDVVQPEVRDMSPSFSLLQGAKKYPLVGPDAQLFCFSLTPTSNDVATLWQEGFVRFNVDDDAGILSAVVSLKGAEPNTTYPVRLIQGGAGDCQTVDGYLTTNGRGNGTLSISEPAVSDRAQVIINTDVLSGDPTYRATEIFRW